ncbi:MAG: acyl-CoA thioesterase II [Pseudomonadota bacterium]
MTSAVDTLLSILDLQDLGDDRFVGDSPQTGRQRVFGGQVIGQAIVAAARTVTAERLIHSMHCYFLRPGDPTVPIEYQVDRLRDGMSFSVRQVKAFQHDKAIYTLTGSFQRTEKGLEYEAAMPSGVPMPEALLSEEALVERFADKLPESIAKYWRRERPIELRPVSLDHYVSKKPLDPVQNIWVRPTAPIPDDPVIQSAVLAYLSDMTLLDTALFVHGRSIFDPQLQVASLDHSMWFHRQTALEDWLLYTQDSTSTSGSRGLTRGALYTREGSLIATTSQEGLMRLKK